MPRPLHAVPSPYHESFELAKALREIHDLLWEKTKGEFDEPQQLQIGNS